MQEDSEYWMADYSTTKSERQSPDEVEARRLRLKNNSKSNEVKPQEVSPRITEDTIKKNRIAIAREQAKQRNARQARVKQQRLEAMSTQQACNPKTELRSKRITDKFAEEKKVNSSLSAMAEAYKNACTQDKNRAPPQQVGNPIELVRPQASSVRRVAISTASGMQIIDKETGEVVKMQNFTAERFSLHKAQLAEKRASKSQNQQATSSELYNYSMATNRIYARTSQGKISVNNVKARAVAASRTSRLTKNQENELNDSNKKPSAQQVSTVSSIGNKTLEFAREQMRIEREIQNSNSTFIGQSHAHTKGKNLDIKELPAARAEFEASEEAKAQMVAKVEERLKKQDGMMSHELAEAENAKEKSIADAIMINKSLAIRSQVEAERANTSKVKTVLTEAFKVHILWRNKLLIISLCVGIFLLAILYFASNNNRVIAKSLQFSNFPVGAIYSGKSAKLVRDTELANNYRTRLSAALSTAPVFAGEYSQAFWGCGQECSITVFVNKRTGKVINQTFGGLSDVNLVDFKLDSSLVKAKGPLFDKEGNKTNQSAMYYFQLENEQLKLIQTAPIEKSADTKS